ncbi:uncharacterized protein G2W53_032392 [Senna tora]|uniref:Uncharacterized protein n=1 Tax=Senna tora TaxID=362788 RepID=A0A834WA74_9FABA|nr:uncharacterized protein G2W53_032392 [Senna tora]
MDGFATLLLQRWAFFGVHRHLGYLSILNFDDATVYGCGLRQWLTDSVIRCSDLLSFASWFASWFRDSINRVDIVRVLLKQVQEFIFVTRGFFVPLQQ